MTDLNAIIAIAYRDFIKLLRDPVRLVSSLVLPLLFIGILGGSLQANMGRAVGYNLLVFTFTGILAQTLFQSTALGVISLIEDRENDFSQEIFVSPISRYSIVFGKILGESLVALPQGGAIVLFGLVVGVPFTGENVLLLVPVAIAVCLLGGAFGVILMANLGSQRSANQIFPFLMLPQFFLAGIFTPIRILPVYLEVLSRISPLRYGVDLTRAVFYAGTSDYEKVVLAGVGFNSAVLAGLFAVFLTAGTVLFVRSERNR
ncbi:MAG TPA: ABC transporter permease [Chloroflexia bacterium]|nr:ABC transporter permease [Chloroflexia bacterium]